MSVWVDVSINEQPEFELNGQMVTFDLGEMGQKGRVQIWNDDTKTLITQIAYDLLGIADLI